jgi:hypothetical protein
MHMHMHRFYSRLDARYEPAIRKMETSIIRLLLVTAFKSSKPDVLQTFFSAYGDSLLGGPDGSSWRAWFALLYVKEPERDPNFQVGGCWCCLMVLLLRGLCCQ